MYIPVTLWWLASTTIEFAPRFAVTRTEAMKVRDVQDPVMGILNDRLVDLQVVDLPGEHSADQGVVDERAAYGAVGVQLPDRELGSDIRVRLRPP